MSNVYLEWVDGFKDLKTFKPRAKTAIKQVLAFYSRVIPNLKARHELESSSQRQMN